MPINDNHDDMELTVNEIMRRAKEYGKQRAVNLDPTDLDYDEETGLYGPPKKEGKRFGLKCECCGEYLSLDDYANWIGTNTDAICRPCKEKDRHIAQKAIEDLDDIDRILAEMEDGDR